MIYDCFTFFNEIELLEIRLHELDHIVDKFILVESTVTFTNKKKPLQFEKNKHLFKDFEKKIIHIVVKDSPNTSNPWEIEKFQFNAIRRGLDNVTNNDTILLSCVDEIPKQESIRKYIKKEEINKVFLQKLSYYYLNLVNGKPWEGTRMLTYKNLPRDIYRLRSSKPDLKIKNGGWHFSYIGGKEKIKEKINSFSHQELNIKDYTDDSKIEFAISNKMDLFGRNLNFKLCTYRNLPTHVKENTKKYSDILLPEPQSLIEQFRTLF